MSVVRKLSMIYLLCAGIFGVQWAFDRDPALERASRHSVAVALETVRAKVVVPGIALAFDGSNRLAAAITGYGSPKRVARAPGAPHHRLALVPRPTVRIPAPAKLVPPKPRMATPNLPSAAVPDLRVAVDVPPPQPVVAAPPPPEVAAPQRQAKASLAPPAPASIAPASLSPAELVRVSMRLKENLTREMLENFSLFLYVSKADTGPWAQRLYVFRKDASGLTLLYNWPASTGRELDEIAANGTRQPSITPQGYYQLDPHRMYRSHFSGQWHEPMPDAMFFNWEHNGLQTGLAIHGATGLEIRQLGTRASAGCIRIAPENAALLFNLIRTEYKGLAPRFAYDRRTATMSNQGVMMHDAAGNLQQADGYKVLVFVENYGGENVVAALF
jgi:lipoprotein-anchoring transpeptidase ErfK/SrfK